MRSFTGASTVLRHAQCLSLSSPGMAVGDNGQPGQQQAQQAQAVPAEAQHPAFPDWMRLRVLEHMGAGWEWPAAVE